MESKENKFKIKCPTTDEDDFVHPSCAHGPTLFFYKDSLDDGYFACAAFRDKRDCKFHLPVSKLTEISFKKHYDAPVEEFRAIRERANTEYCHTCDKVLMSSEASTHNTKHSLTKLTKLHFRDPTTLLKPVQNDKSQAQYFFDEKALKFFIKCFKELKISKVICIGAPRLHAYILQLNKELSIKSFLLDFDHRFYYFYNDNQFAWYNMCNNHFFDESQKVEFLRFLKNHSSNEERTLIFTDPPFGCRTETITQTLRDLTRLYNNINKLPHQPLPFFWIFPYFMSQYIKNEMPEMEMSDYKVNYINHDVYTDKRKLGSPARIFTNVPLNLLQLPIEEGYKYCAACQFYTALENRHCQYCKCCPSKNGSTYRHCEMCGLCVKPNYVHCNICRRCTQVEGHNCKEYQLRQRCWICLQVGHIERQCEAWEKSRKKFVLTAVENVNDRQIRCLLCDRLGHNERKCPMRGVFIEESNFLGNSIVSLK